MSLANISLAKRVERNRFGRDLRCLFWLSLAIVAFYWKIVFTRQFSMLTVGETVNQAYSWFHFWSESVRGGRLPLWDPYAFAGRSYIGEMQTAAFYPVHLLLALFPPNGNGLMSERLYHLYFVFTHLLAAYFMFALIRELGLDQFPALLGGLCYSIGGFVGNIAWPHLLESSVWLPVQFVLLLRALRAPALAPSALCAALAGLALGLSILAGGLHVVMMQVMVLITAAIYYNLHTRTEWRRAALIIGVLTATALAAGAVQLLPSAEFSAHAVRFISGTFLPANQKIPIAYLVDSILPRTLPGYLFSWNPPGKLMPGEVLSPYFGVFPLLLAVIGFWKCREYLWVRYSAGLVLGAVVFSLGASSLLYGLTYVLVPLLWMAREASRFLYMAHFGLVILAAYGAQAVFSGGETQASWSPVQRALRWLASGSAAALTIPAVFGRPELNPWTEWSLLLIVLSYALFHYIAQGADGAAARFLIVAFILFDLHAFDFLPVNRIEAARTDSDQLQHLIGMRGAANFLKTQPGPFRIQVVATPPLNIGDAYGIETLNGGAVTMATNYMDLTGRGSPGIDLLNVRYFLKPASAPDLNPIYADANWKVYANPSAYPRAWIEYAGAPVDQRGPEAVLQEHSARHIAVKVNATSPAVLVLSELYYPGWEARVNGSLQPIGEVHGGLRGISIPQGETQVTVDYVPRSVLLGALLTLLTFAVTLLAAVIWQRRE